MIIVDSQVHIWAPDRPDRPWAPGQAHRTHRPVPLGAEELIREMDEAGVSRAILVPPSWEGDRNDLVLEAAAEHPDRFAVFGRLPVESPDGPALLAELAREPHLYGFRFTFHNNPHKKWLTDGTADWLWPAAEKAGTPLMILPVGSLPYIDTVAKRYPDLKLILDHLSLSRHHKDSAAFEDLPQLLALARNPNVAVKASALPDYSTEEYPYRGLHQYLRPIFETFGPKRVFWGADISRAPCTYRQMVTMFTEEMDWLTEEDKEWIMGRALCEWIGWPLNSATPRPQDTALHSAGLGV